ncbi:MAG: hypothetical protein HUJ56_08640 [Erysipelotrichaceae bacterium]|nr:hypothetical protein [Erysipelotrichaceae bacterium]
MTKAELKALKDYQTELQDKAADIYEAKAKKSVKKNHEELERIKIKLQQEKKKEC